MYQILLFDLDGTLTASGEGITKSVQYALGRMGREADDLKALEVFVGPPLLEQFMSHCNMTEEEANLSVKYYRERYNVTGIFENHPYDGIKEMLEKLKRAGFQLGVASSKPDAMVQTVLEHFELMEYFDAVTGSDPDRLKMTKAEVIEITLDKLNCRNKKSQAVMIGDRKYDVYGAKEVGLDCIGVTYGYGSYEELSQAHACKIAGSVKELEEILLTGRSRKLYDIGKELFSTPAYPGDPAPEKKPFMEIEKGAPCNLSVITMGSHNGTHLDAPKHFCPGRHGVDKIPLEKCMGQCKVAEFSGIVGKEDMERMLSDGTRKLLIKGDILLTPESARVCAGKNLDLIGVEDQTVGDSQTQQDIHRILLGAEVVILEGLVLSDVPKGEYFLAAQPVKMADLDGSPVRPVLIKE